MRNVPAHAGKWRGSAACGEIGQGIAGVRVVNVVVKVTIEERHAADDCTGEVLRRGIEVALCLEETHASRDDRAQRCGCVSYRHELWVCGACAEQFGRGTDDPEIAV